MSTNTKAYFTRNGQAVSPIGPDDALGQRLDQRGEAKQDGGYVRMQILPAVPQRFELVNVNNLVRKNVGAGA